MPQISHAGLYMMQQEIAVDLITMLVSCDGGCECGCECGCEYVG